MMTTRRRSGFTLIELVIVVAILFMMLAVAMPLFFQIIAQRRLTGAVERVATDLRYVQSLAVTQGLVHRLHSGADGAEGRPGEYRLERDNGAGGWVAVNGWYKLSSDYEGSSLQSVKDNGGTTVTTYDVRFNAQGAVDITTGVGTYPIVLTLVGKSGATRTVQVLRSGVVRMQ
jgi:prepilin-type N-terminal cleavage/methylation domain-containing protein